MINMQTWLKNKVGGRCFTCQKNFGTYEQKFVESSEVILRSKTPDLVKDINRYGKMLWSDKAICEKCALEITKEKRVKKEKSNKKNKEVEKNEEIIVPVDTVAID